MKIKRKILEIDEKLCDGCGQCVPACAEGAIEVVDGKARLVSEIYCDGLGACLGECPKGALKIIEKEAEEFDPEAVEEYLKHKTPKEVDREIPCCPAMSIQSVKKINNKDEESTSYNTSELSNWPIQIKLVPATAPFLKEANLLVAADCTAFAYPNFHKDFLKNKILLIGCPKLDDTEIYLQKFIEIFKTVEVKKITVLIMEVPCCSKLPKIIEKALNIAMKNIPMEEVVISTKGVTINKGDLVR
ncbi:MAG: 4Fe-4S binding protein [Thermodesulfovibrionales bacterium]|nr:4Fe-4S binding protein [Thermodesulfovibrionales bacterium]